MEEDKKKKSEMHITNNFYAPIGQYIEHVEHNHFGMDRDGNFRFVDAKGDDVQKKLFPVLPTKEEMCKVVMETYKGGYWWGNRSWAVVYRVYQMKGYMKGISEFVRDVETWQIELSYECNYDAVQKPIAKSLLIGPVEKWELNGANVQNVKLANALLVELNKNKEK